MLGAAAWQHGGLASPARRLLHGCLPSVGRGMVTEASAQPQQQRHQQQRQRQRRRASSLAEPAAVPDAAAAPRQQQHSNLQPPARGAQQQTQQAQAQAQQHGAIELVVGPMFAGKSTELLRRVAQCEAAGLSVAVVKSSKDTRYCAASVVTHNGLKRVGGGHAMPGAPACLWV